MLLPLNEFEDNTSVMKNFGITLRRGGWQDANFDDEEQVNEIV